MEGFFVDWGAWRIDRRDRISHEDQQADEYRGDKARDDHLVGFALSVKLGDDVGYEKGDRVGKDSYRDLEGVEPKRCPAEELLEDQVAGDQGGDKDPPRMRKSRSRKVMVRFPGFRLPIGVSAYQ